MKILFKRGKKSTLPLLTQGEPAVTTDTNEFFIGNGTQNIQIPTLNQLNGVRTVLPLNSGITVNNGRTPYFITMGNRVDLEGEITGVVANTTIATLPSPYIPPNTLVLPVALNTSAGGYAIIAVKNTGDIVILYTSDSTKGISLCGTSFYL